MWHGGKWGEVSPTFDQFSGMKNEKMGKSQKEKGRKIGHMRERKKGKKGKEKFSRLSDGRSSMVRELKSVHVKRATHGYQNLGVLSNSKS